MVISASKIHFFKSILLLTLFSFSINAQSGFRFQFDTFKIQNWPNIHSFAYAASGDKVLMIGGRLDGIHSKEEGFEYDRANKMMYVWNTRDMTLTSSAIPFSGYEISGFLSSSNSTFAQDQNFLYMMGGYGQASDGSYYTYPFFAKINLAQAITAIESSGNVESAFTFIRDTFFAVAGGQLRIKDSLFYLVGGNYFEGKYSSNSSNVKQIYTDAFVLFRLQETKDSLAYNILYKKTDDYNFHRRDFNMSPFIDRDGKEKMMVYSGVFQHNLDKPFLNTSVIDSIEVREIFDFDQKFCAYNCAKLNLFDGANNRSHQIFFGGMAEYYRDSLGVITYDSYVPFVKSVSTIIRDEFGKFSEWLLTDTMPGFMGCNAEFFISPEIALYSSDIVDLSAIKEDTIFAGYLFGGIYNPGTDRNPWQNEKAHLTLANPYIVKVHLIKDQSTNSCNFQNKKSNIKLQLQPNPARFRTQLEFKSDKKLNRIQIWIQNSEGKNLAFTEIKNPEENKIELDLKNLAAGHYHIYALADSSTLMHATLQVLSEK
ncbi:MAG: hypothetical protein IPM34_05285 [Saprospiraceae bacterium]|nr:hypothetical protein [Saprospiraceae bacterium]